MIFVWYFVIFFLLVTIISLILWRDSPPADLATLGFAFVVVAASYGWAVGLVVGGIWLDQQTEIVGWETLEIKNYAIEYGVLPLHGFGLDTTIILGTGDLKGQTMSSVAVYYIDQGRLRCYGAEIEKALIYDRNVTIPLLEKEIKAPRQANGKLGRNETTWRIYVDLAEILGNKTWSGVNK